MGILQAIGASLSAWQSSGQVASLLWTMAQVSAGLFALALTLVALVPTLVEIARVKSASYLSGDIARRRLKRALRWVGYAIWIYGVVTLLCLVGSAIGGVGIYALLAASVLFIVGIAILVHSGHVIAQVTRSVI